MEFLCREVGVGRLPGKACKRKYELNLEGWAGIHHVDGEGPFILNEPREVWAAEGLEMQWQAIPCDWLGPTVNNSPSGRCQHEEPHTLRIRILSITAGNQWIESSRWYSQIAFCVFKQVNWFLLRNLIKSEDLWYVKSPQDRQTN